MEKCNYFNCPMCNWGYCTGDKEYMIEMGSCSKKKYNNDEY